jgi:hypothetical protein
VYLGVVKDDNEGPAPEADVLPDKPAESKLVAHQDEPFGELVQHKLGCPICGLASCGHNLGLVELPV